MANEAPITLAHGAGGGLSAQLIEQVFIKAFGQLNPGPLPDAASIPLANLQGLGDRLAFTTDSFVVSPITFPGGDIGKLAVCGTVNDLAVAGAKPLYLSAGFVLEEGLLLAELEAICQSMAKTAQEAGVQIVTGDTKVVAKRQADKLYINTSGVGVIPGSIQIDISQAKPGDAILVSGFIGDHGAAIMLARQELGLQAQLNSDCAPLNTLIEPLLAQIPSIKVLRDATRGGLGAVLSEIASASGVTIALDEKALPIRRQTYAICDLLGMEPLFFANEGMVALVVPPQKAETALALLKSHPYGMHACCVGQVEESSQGLLYVKTAFGSKRMIKLPEGIQLPRIC